jgi:uncharacterized protein YkwD
MAFAAKQKTVIVNKKRVGKHRKHTQKELRHYWPYLPLVAIVAAGLLCNMLWPQGSGVLGSHSDLSSNSLLMATNADREDSDITDLALNVQLSQAAQSKAMDMVAGNYWSHNTPYGATPWSFIEKAGYSYSNAGENLAYGFADAPTVMNAWMHSPEHRKNLLDRGYTEVGFGVASSPNYVGHGAQTVVVAMYGHPATGAQAAVTPSQSTSGAEVKGASTVSQPIARVAVLGDNTSVYAPAVLLGVTALAVGAFILRHARLLHRSLVRGEVFVAQHWMLDVVLVALATIGFVLTRNSAFIL